MLNSVTIAARLTSDITDLRYANSGTPLVNFSVAQNTGPEDARRAHFFDVTCFRDLAVQLVNSSIGKGDVVLIHGRLEMQTWADKATGEKRTKVAIIANEVGAEATYANVSAERLPSPGSAPQDDPFPGDGGAAPVRAGMLPGDDADLEAEF
jgi:single-strand DNA-binding protein